MRAAQEKFFDTHDGTSLFYRYWPRAALQHLYVAHIVDVSAELRYASDARAYSNIPMPDLAAPGARSDVARLVATTKH